jgi:hypothetical protein
MKGKAMKANELRIGNYILLKGFTKPTQVWIIDTTETSTKTTASPILLTEEWLLKFGIEKMHDGNYWNKKLCIRKDRNEFYALYEQGRIYIQYVHQLQNLYFALTGEELTKGD